MWDRRTLNEESPEPVGVLAGHADGVTFIDSKADARYLISNSKDQTIKLWDMRRFSNKEAQTVSSLDIDHRLDRFGCVYVCFFSKSVDSV